MCRILRMAEFSRLHLRNAPSCAPTMIMMMMRMMIIMMMKMVMTVGGKGMNLIKC